MSTDDDSNQSTKVMTTFTNNLPHGCLRRVVKRASSFLPYEMTLVGGSI